MKQNYLRLRLVFLVVVSSHKQRQTKTLSLVFLNLSIFHHFMYISIISPLICHLPCICPLGLLSMSFFPLILNFFAQRSFTFLFLCVLDDSSDIKCSIKLTRDTSYYWRARDRGSFKKSLTLTKLSPFSFL